MQSLARRPAENPGSDPSERRPSGRGRWLRVLFAGGILAAFLAAWPDRQARQDGDARQGDPPAIEEPRDRSARLPAAGGESRTASFFLQVLDGSSGAPLGASRLLLITSDGEIREARGDHSGTVRLPASEGEPLYCLVEGPSPSEYSARLLVSSRRSGWKAADVLQVPLVPLGSIEIHLTDEAGIPVEGIPIGILSEQPSREGSFSTLVPSSASAIEEELRADLLSLLTVPRRTDPAPSLFQTILALSERPGGTAALAGLVERADKRIAEGGVSAVQAEITLPVPAQQITGADGVVRFLGLPATFLYRWSAPVQQRVRMVPPYEIPSVEYSPQGYPRKRSTVSDRMQISGLISLEDELHRRIEATAWRRTSIRGAFLLSPDAPRPDLRVKLSRVYPHRDSGGQSLVQVAATQADRLGRFAFEGIEPGLYEVSASWQEPRHVFRLARRQILLEAGMDYDLGFLTPASGVSCQMEVRLVAEGKPLDPEKVLTAPTLAHGLQVEVHSLSSVPESPERIWERFNVPIGTPFTILGLVPGEYQVVTGPGRNPVECRTGYQFLEQTLEKRIFLDPSSSLVLEFPVLRTFRVPLIARPAGSARPPSLQAFIASEQSRTCTRVELERSGADRYEGEVWLPAGVHRLLILGANGTGEDDAGNSAGAGFTEFVADDAGSPVTVNLQETRAFPLLVLEENGEPAAHAVLALVHHRLYQGRGRTTPNWILRTDGEGRATVPGVQDGWLLVEFSGRGEVQVQGQEGLLRLRD